MKELSAEDIKEIEMFAGPHARQSTGWKMTLGQYCLDLIWNLRMTQGWYVREKVKKELMVAQAFYVSDSTLHSLKEWDNHLSNRDKEKWIKHARDFIEDRDKGI